MIEVFVEKAVAVVAAQGGAAGFAPLFGAGAGEPQDAFFATADQALFLNNGSMVRSWLAPSAENLTARLGKLTDARALAEELYLSILTRAPSDAEVAAVKASWQKATSVVLLGFRTVDVGSRTGLSFDYQFADLAVAVSQQQGLRSKGHDDAYLTEQETRIRRFHEVINDYIEGRR